MFFGVISKEVYEVLVLVMNKLGVCSNMGEGGEDSDCIIGIY